MARKLPKTIYGHHYLGDGPENVFFKTDEDAKSLVDAGERLVVGEYRLVGTVEIVNETKVTPTQPIRTKRRK